MGSTIVLDPYDCYKLTIGLGKTFEQLTMNELELNVVDGIIMPNLKMQKSDGRCAFLREDNLCNIHTIRPGICRMFPLGRYWEDETHFKYIVQKGECNKDNLSKIKLKKWLGIEGLAEYEAWTKEAKELSNPALLAVTQKSDNPCFEKALLWSIRTNRAIHALPAEDRPFPNVKSAMDAMAKQADLAAVLPKDFPLPARYAHPVVLTRMIRVLREGRAQTADQALEVVKQDLKALTADVQVEQWEYDEVVAIKPMFLLSDYQ